MSFFILAYSGFFSIFFSLKQPLAIASYILKHSGAVSHKKILVSILRPEKNNFYRVEITCLNKTGNFYCFLMC